jgi:hopene-associated glycosyltransferase HpnB
MITLFCFLSLAAWFYLAFFRADFWQPLFIERASTPEVWPSVAIIIPARNEETTLYTTMPRLLGQSYPGSWAIYLVDDNSEDSTVDVALGIARKMGAEDRLIIVKSPLLAEGWAGKVAAMHAGMTNSRSDYMLFTDADISHHPSSLSELVSFAVQNKMDLTSIMVKLHAKAPIEKLLIPAFVYFFQMLFPFRESNDINARLAAAAGGVMLVKRDKLEQVGGLVAIKDKIIDDCALAKLMKDKGARTWLSLSNDVESIRPYVDAADIWGMIRRTAYTQLRYNPMLLAGTIVGLFVIFLAPIFGFFAGSITLFVALACLALMTATYRPIVSVYGASPVFAITLPLAALFYIGATLDSARVYYQGKGGLWKGRHQA